MYNVQIDKTLCIACGICGQICPRHIPEIVKQKDEKYTQISPERIHLCMECGHCVAVCPNNAISLNGMFADDYEPLRTMDVDSNSLLTLMKQRRSVRKYKDKRVPREIINKLVDAAQTAPTGSGSTTTGVIIVDDPEKLARLSELSYDMYEGLIKAFKNPVARFFIKRKVGIEKYSTLKDFVLPGMHWYIKWYREGKSNEILRDSPAIMLFHAPKHEPVGAENCLIAAFHVIMMAQTLGIGTCFNDLVPPVCNRMPEIRQLLGLDPGRNVYASVTLGYPKYSFKKVPPRMLADVRYLD